MIRSEAIFQLLILVACLFLLFSCTVSLLETEVTDPALSKLEGDVELYNGSSPAGVYVWLEATELSAFTDDSGHFHLELPGSNSGGLTNGAFKLHFYIANYKLETSTVLIKDGKFVRSRGDVNSRGNLSATKKLLKLLSISTRVEPENIDVDFDGLVEVTVSLRALFDSVTVVLPKLFSHSSDAVIFKKIDSDQVITVTRSENMRSFSNERIGPEERILKYDFYFKPGMLSEGQYEVVPFLLVSPQDLPSGLLSSLGANVSCISSDFLKIPFRRDGGSFTIFGQ